jgi:hypothetical protein
MVGVFATEQQEIESCCVKSRLWHAQASSRFLLQTVDDGWSQSVRKLQGHGGSHWTQLIIMSPTRGCFVREPVTSVLLRPLLWSSRKHVYEGNHCFLVTNKKGRREYNFIHSNRAIEQMPVDHCSKPLLLDCFCSGFSAWFTHHVFSRTVCVEMFSIWSPLRSLPSVSSAGPPQAISLDFRFIVLDYFLLEIF